MSSHGGRILSTQRSEYHKLISLLIAKHPYLSFLTDFMDHQRGNQETCCSAVLEFGDDKVVQVKIEGIKDLSTYLTSPASLDCSRQMFILEDLSVDFINLLGPYLQIDPTLFVSHLRDTHWKEDTGRGLPQGLPSFQDQRSFLTIKYYEPRIFEIESIENLRAYGAPVNVKRQVTFCDHKVGLVRQQVSFWSRAKANGGWDGKKPNPVSFYTLLIPVAFSTPPTRFTAA
jgi:hypothetical protein